MAWAERMLACVADSVLLNAGELIQIQPGEPAQYLHRDSDAWPAPIGLHPLVVNCMLALGPFTAANGATRVVLGSHRWPAGRCPEEHELRPVELRPGDALLFPGDLVHGGGANRTDQPRRGVSLSYCAGWLRPVENSVLNVPPGLARHLTPGSPPCWATPPSTARPTAAAWSACTRTATPPRRSRPASYFDLMARRLEPR